MEKITSNEYKRTVDYHNDTKSMWAGMRSQYLLKHYIGHVRQLGDLADVQVEYQAAPLLTSKAPCQWGDVNYHINSRIATSAKLFEVFPELAESRGYVESVIKQGYKMSLLPLNCMLGPDVFNQFIPPDDYYSPHATKSIDPYGIYTPKSRVVSVGKKGWLGSCKFPHTLLVNVNGYCPIGCSDCYKSYFTREGHAEEMGVNDIEDSDAPALTHQMERLTEWLNENSEVYDVIISGGEPLVRSNDHFRVILKSLRHAKHLKILRICTGTLFLGLPFRFDDQFLDIIQEFELDTGIRIRIHAHLSNCKQISPEAVIAVSKIRARGISIYSQVPIREGLNFFSGDLEKSIEQFVRLGKMQAILGIEPYVFIVDMHPRTNKYYVALESLLKLWCLLVESHDYPGVERPRSLSILFEEGNIILSGTLLLSMHKHVDKDRHLVTYKIPSPRFLSGIINNCSQGQAYFTYREPVIIGLNDDPNSLRNLQKTWLTFCERKV